MISFLFSLFLLYHVRQKSVQFSINHHNINQLQYSYEYITQQSDRLVTITNEKCKFEEAKKALDEQISILKLQKDKLENVISNIRAYGKKYINSVKDFKACPLCGNDKISKKEVTAFLDGEFKHQDNILYEMQIEYDEITQKVSQLQKNEEEARKFQVIKDDIYSSYTEYFYLKSNEQISKPLKEIKNEFKLYESTLKELVSSKIEYDLYFSQLESINYEMAQANYINDYTRLISDVEVAIPLYAANKELSFKQRIERLIAHLQQKKTFWESHLPVLEAIISEKTSYIKTVEGAINDFDKKVANIKENRNKNNSLKDEYNRLQQFFDSVIPLFQSEVTSLSRIELSNQCDVLLQCFTSFLKSEETAPKISLLNSQIENLAGKIERSNHAFELLSKLKPSSEYAQEFIKQHIEHISNIFCNLHTPKEFNRLELYAGKIIGIREAKKIPINQMSTGQKTAVVLSVFLTLNSAMKSAPQFILFDEPVANIDDLNILSLLDFFREMVITNHKQIFFTTASYNVRRLFRRKFSFMQDEFVEFAFDRGSNQKSVVTIKKYTQDGLLSEEKKPFFE